jgi:hypothetical protein
VKELGFHSAFSNEAFELWYILHFDYLDAKIDRKAYIAYLDKIFKRLKLGKYKKNNEDMYAILEQFGDQANAMKNAERLLVLHEGKTLYDSMPSTRVHLLIGELNKYL